jgi:hypothetical protein
MTLFDELRSIVSALDGAGVDYALVGGLAVAVWGAPRATKDIDLLIQPDALPRAMAAARDVVSRSKPSLSSSRTAPAFSA